MRLACLLPVLVLACGGDDGAVNTATESSTSTDATTTTASAGTTGDATSNGGSTDGDELGTSSSAADTTGTTAADDSSSGGAASTGDIPVDCVGIEPIELLDPFVTPIDAPAWMPGGSVTVGATMHNNGPDFLDYPSIIVESDDPLVTSGAPGHQLFGILEDQSVEISVVFDADRAIAPGTDVEFTIRMAVLDVVCPNGAVAQVQATVE